MPPLPMRHPSAYANAKNRFPPCPLRLGKDVLEVGITRLLADGELVLPEFTKALEFLNKLCVAKENHVWNEEEKAPKRQSATSVGPLKGVARIREKCESLYGDLTCPVGPITDVVRATMAFDNSKQIQFAIEKLLKWEGTVMFNGSTTTYRVAQAKELYSKDLQALYGDVKLSLLFYVNDVPDGHVCELQLNTVAMIAAKLSKKGHLAYEAERTMDGNWKKHHPGTMPPRLAAMQEEEVLDPSERTVVYAGESRGMQGATLEAYIEMYEPVVTMLREAYSAPRAAFDADPESPALLARVKALSSQVADRWTERFRNGGAWTTLS